MSNFFTYADYGLSRKNFNFPRPRDCVAIKVVEVGSESFPLWKRGIKGDFFKYLQPSVTPEISPGPSFPKRGNPNLHPQPAGKSKSVKILGLALLLLFFPGWLIAQEPLRAGTIFSATQAPLWAAKEGRFFEKYGIKNLEVIQFSGGQPVTRALIGGDIQISTTGGAAVVNARLKGADTVIIARTVGVFPYTLYVSKDIRNAAELKGKKLAVSTVGGSGYVAMQYALRKLGLDPDKDVAMLQVGDFGTRLASLASGTVQGTLLLPPFTLASTRARLEAALRFGRQRDPIPDQPDHYPAILHKVAA